MSKRRKTTRAQRQLARMAREIHGLRIAVEVLLDQVAKLNQRQEGRDLAVEILSRADGQDYWRGWTDCYQAVAGTAPPRPGPARPELRVVPAPESGR